MAPVASGMGDSNTRKTFGLSRTIFFAWALQTMDTDFEGVSPGFESCFYCGQGTSYKSGLCSQWHLFSPTTLLELAHSLLEKSKTKYQVTASMGFVGDNKWSCQELKDFLRIYMCANKFLPNSNVCGQWQFHIFWDGVCQPQIGRGHQSIIWTNV